MKIIITVSASHDENYGAMGQSRITSEIPDNFDGVDLGDAVDAAIRKAIIEHKARVTENAKEQEGVKNE